MGLKSILIITFLFAKTLHSQTVDYRILKSINQGNLPNWDKTMKGVSFSVYPIMPTCVGYILAQGYSQKNETLIRNGYKSAICIGFAIGLSTGLKYVINRTRPYSEYPGEIIKRDNAGPYSFPSGHTTAAFATATAVSLTYRKWYVALPAYTYASVVGYSRMRLGMHYPTDVLGGMILGIGSGFLTWQLDKIINKK